MLSMNISSAPIRSNIPAQKCCRATLSALLIFCNTESLYAVMCKCLSNMHQTVSCGMPVSREARHVDFLGLQAKLSLSCSIAASETCRYPVDFACCKEQRFGAESKL